MKCLQTTSESSLYNGHSFTVCACDTVCLNTFAESLNRCGAVRCGALRVNCGAAWHVRNATHRSVWTRISSVCRSCRHAVSTLQPSIIISHKINSFCNQYISTRASTPLLSPHQFNGRMRYSYTPVLYTEFSSNYSVIITSVYRPTQSDSEPCLCLHIL